MITIKSNRESFILYINTIKGLQIDFQLLNRYAKVYKYVKWYILMGKFLIHE